MMPTVESLTTKVETLNASVGWWNTAIIVMMVVAAIAATGLVITQWIAVKKAELLASTETQLSELKDRIKEAEIAEAGSRAAYAQKEAGQANEKAGDANERAARLEIEAAGQRERAAQAETKLLELQQTLADRSLTDAQAENMLGKVNLFSGQEYTVTAYWDSNESLAIANRINQILLSAGWRYNPEGSKSSMLGGKVGIQVWTHPDAAESTKRAAKAIIDALNEEGLAAEGRTQNPQNPRTDMINLDVGSKR